MARKKRIGIFTTCVVVALGVVGGIHCYKHWDRVTLAAGHVGHWFQGTFGFEVTHQYDDGTVVVDATCTEKGSKIYTCRVCGEERTEVIEKKPHTEKTLDAVSPTCLGTGLSAGLKCDECGEVIIAQEEVAALGHTYADGTCLNCGEAEPVFIDNFSNWTMPVSEGYIVDGNKLTFEGTNELVFSTKEKYNSISLTFKISETQDVRGAFQIGWGAQSQNDSINDLPYVQFNYDRAVLCLPDGTKYDTSWLMGEVWHLTIDAENSNVVLSVDGEVVYNVDASWWTQENWGLPGYLILIAESNCALTLILTEMMPQA